MCTFPYAVKEIDKKHKSKHYAVNRFFTKNPFGRQDPGIQKWTFINVHLSKKFIKSQNHFYPRVPPPTTILVLIRPI